MRARSRGAGVQVQVDRSVGAAIVFCVMRFGRLLRAVELLENSDLVAALCWRLMSQAREVVLGDTVCRRQTAAGKEQHPGTARQTKRKSHPAWRASRVPPASLVIDHIALAACVAQGTAVAYFHSESKPGLWLSRRASDAPKSDLPNGLRHMPCPRHQCWPHGLGSPAPPDPATPSAEAGGNSSSGSKKALTR